MYSQINFSRQYDELATKNCAIKIEKDVFHPTQA